MAEELTGVLRAELDRIAHDTAGFTPDPKTWARARRARARDRATTALAVTAALACLAAIVLIARPHDQAPVPAGTPHSQLGVPRTIWPVPERLVEPIATAADESVWDKRVAETDLAIGRGAVALTAGTSDELAVVITAIDGRYHPLALPGYVGAGLINSAWGVTPLAISPDGTRLAYGWWDPSAPLDRPMPAGVRVVNLEDGTIRTVPLKGGNGIMVDSITWSPDGRWISWGASRTTSWTPTNSGLGAPIAGRIDPNGVPSVLPKRLNLVTRSAITSAGLLTVRDGDRLITWDGTHIDRHPWPDESDGYAATAWSPSGRWLALSTPGPSERLTYAGSDGSRHQVPLPVGDGDDADLTPLGWLDDNTAVVLIQPAQVDEDLPDKKLALIELASTTDAGPGFNVIGTVRTPAPAHLSVAVDLLGADRPTVIRPEPHWPWSDERKWQVGLLAAAALAIGVGLVRRWKRPTGPTPRG